VELIVLIDAAAQLSPPAPAWEVCAKVLGGGPIYQK
jgi:hypothetical protein